MSWKSSVYMGFACIMKFCKAPKPAQLNNMRKRQKFVQKNMKRSA